MTRPDSHSLSKASMTLLSRLLLGSSKGVGALLPADPEMRGELDRLSRDEFDNLIALAQSNHVVIRGLQVAAGVTQNVALRELAESALATERARIDTAIRYLSEICEAFEVQGLGIAVIKSLDHWPDLGSDLDLYSDADAGEIRKLMKSRFKASIAPRSWGDRLAGKWNFIVPGLPEAVEIHMGRLGQTGEQLEIASNLLRRTRQVNIGAFSFRVASVSDRLMISTLQRMYRHFYFRLCDIVDSAELAQSGAIEYAELRFLATSAGIWEGVATYLAIVSDYVRSFRGQGLELPEFVTASARFGGNQIYYKREFLRVPILPQSARLFGAQLAGVLGRGNIQSGARLSLLPWLATAAVVGQKLTGSDKGIW